MPNSQTKTAATTHLAAEYKREIVEKVAVGLSGGVDSAVSLFLLKKKYPDIIAVFSDYFDCLGKPEDDTSCCSPGGLDRARETASFLNVPFYRMDFKEEFRTLVMTPFIESYNRGFTPNPCVWCNSRLRFSMFQDKLKSMGVTLFATGHYASLDGKKLCRARDLSKDQSYFLYAVERERFENVVFPLSGMTKQQVRKIALKENLPAASSVESQDCCILAQKSLKEYLKEKTGLKPGKIIDEKGGVIGEHSGYQNYTVGQGVALGGMNQKLYVSRILPGENKIIAQSREKIYRKDVEFRFNPKVFFASEGEKLRAKLRSTQKPGSCTIEKLDLKSNICKIKFKEPVWAPSPGQSAVIYRGEELCGGGEIIQ